MSTEPMTVEAASAEPRASVRAFLPGFAWQGVDSRPYKQDASAPFCGILRQVLFDEPPLQCELRYFEIEPGGYSTLERHQHTHAVMILRGHGRCLLANEVHALATFDLVTIPAWTWHQFRAAGGEPLGFLCMVNRMRDRPQLPSQSDLAALQAFPAVAAFLAG